MADRGRKIPEWVNHRIKQIAIEVRESLGSLRYPTASEIREELRAALAEEGDGGKLEYLPGERHIRKVLANLPQPFPPISDIENPWSLGVSEDHNIPDEATGALLTMWRFARTDVIPMPFTIRIARWVCKLRWVPEAGGSPHGEVINPALLYVRAVQYSGREHKVEMIKDGKGMRSGVLDAQLMLSLPARRMAQRIGVLEDDDGIDYQDELGDVAPHLAAAASVARNTEPLQLSDAERAYLVERVSELGDSSQTVWELMCLGFVALSKDPRQQRLTKEQVKACVVAMLEDLVKTYKEGGLDDWNPPLDALLEPYLE